MEKDSKIIIVDIAWLDKCVEMGKKVDEKEYIIWETDEKDADGDVAMSGANSEPAPEPRRSARNNRSSATPAPAPAPTSAPDAAAPPAKLKRGRSAIKMDDSLDAGVKKLRVGTVKEEDEDKAEGDKKAKVATPPAEEQEGEEEEKPAKKVRAKRGAAKAAAATSAASAPAPAPALAPAPAPAPTPAPAPSPSPPPPPKIKTVVAAKGTAPVDELCPVKANYHVYVDEKGVIYDGSLNQTNIGRNANKFYYVQLIKSNTGCSYGVWTRWGRVGENGQSAYAAGPGTNIGVAYAAFEKKFKAKSGLSWVDRFGAPRGGKYTFIEKNYADSDSEDEDTEKKAKGKGKAKGEVDAEKEPEVESKLAKPLQDLMALIFNTGIMANQMRAMSYDANKLPLGKLSKKTLNQGYLILKYIGELITDPTISQDRFGTVASRAFLDLTNQYYSIIPHSFGRMNPPVINSAVMLQKEVDLVESLGDMAISTEIMKVKGPTDKDGNPIHMLDAQFAGLGLNEATPLDKTSSEFKYLSEYMIKTHGTTHINVRLKIMDIFRIERQGEHARFKSSGYDAIKSDNRALLWHGSRTTNFAGILSQGLRIAPPEAPVNGYMFGKGIYLADMSTKSANYCCAGQSYNQGLLLLCEAQLGDPMMELANASYQAAEDCKKLGRLATKGKGRMAPLKWMDAGVVAPELKGIKMPDPSVATGDTKENGLCLWYNEVSFLGRWFGDFRVIANIWDFFSTLSMT